MNDQQKVVIGYVLSPHGINGWLKVISYTDPIDNFFAYKKVFINKESEYLSYEIDDSTASGKTIRIKLSGIDDRNQSDELAQALRLSMGQRPQRNQSDELAEALVHSTVTASFTIETFGTERIRNLSIDEYDLRLKEFRRISKTS